MGLFDNLNGIADGMNSLGASVSRNQRNSEIRDARNTLQQIQANQEIEQARKAGDKDAERIAMLKKQNLQKQANFNLTLDLIVGVFTLLIFLFIGALIWWMISSALSDL